MLQVSPMIIMMASYRPVIMWRRKWARVKLPLNFISVAVMRVVTLIYDEQLIDDDCFSSGQPFFYRHKLGNDHVFDPCYNFVIKPFFNANRNNLQRFFLLKFNSQILAHHKKKVMCSHLIGSQSFASSYKISYMLLFLSHMNYVIKVELRRTLYILFCCRCCK